MAQFMSQWAERLGLSDVATFEDVYGLDPEVRLLVLVLCHPFARSDYSRIQLLDMVTQPVKAVLCIFPITEVLEKKRKEKDQQIRENGQPEVDPTLVFIEQKACSVASVLTPLFS